jgi:hypothetical protein
MKNGFFWDITPCGSCKNRRFGGILGISSHLASVASYSYCCSYFTDSCHPDEGGAKFLRNVSCYKSNTILDTELISVSISWDVSWNPVDVSSLGSLWCQCQDDVLLAISFVFHLEFSFFNLFINLLYVQERFGSNNGRSNYIMTCKFGRIEDRRLLGHFHGGNNEECCLLGYDVVWL